jgi:hypothetical protein
MGLPPKVLLLQRLPFDVILKMRLNNLTVFEVLASLRAPVSHPKIQEVDEGNISARAEAVLSII